MSTDDWDWRDRFLPEKMSKPKQTCSSRDRGRKGYQLPTQITQADFQAALLFLLFPTFS